MAQVTYTGNGDVSNTNNLGYSFTFPALSAAEVLVSVNNVAKTPTTDYTIVNFTPAGSSNAYILFTSSTARGTGTVRIYRQTDGSSLQHTFQAGSAIKANDLNKSNQQVLYLAEESREAVNNLALGDAGSAIQINGSNIAANSITSDKILNLEVKTADIDNLNVTTAKLENSTGTTDGVTTAKIADQNITTAKIADDAVTDDKLSNTGATAGAYTLPDITVNAQGRITSATSRSHISTSEIQDDAVTLAKISDAAQVALAPVPTGTVLSFAGTTAPTGYFICSGDTVPNGTGTIQNITADFSALYAVVGATLPDMIDNRFINYANSNIKALHDQDWKSFQLKSTAGTYVHEASMGKDTANYQPASSRLFTGGASGTAYGIQLKWETDDVSIIRPKGIVLLPIIKY